MMSLAWQMAPKGRRAASFTEIVVNFLAPPELFSEFRDYIDRPTHDRLVALRQTGRIPREGKKGRRDDLARLPFHFHSMIIPSRTPLDARCGRFPRDRSAPP